MNSTSRPLSLSEWLSLWLDGQAVTRCTEAQVTLLRNITDMQNRDAVFCLFHSDNLIFMQMRSKNGTWGFPGGMVEPTESLFGALAREVAEEINTSLQLGEVEYVSSHPVREGLTSHVFSCKVTYDQLMKISYNALSRQATHSEELNGIGIFDIDRQYFYNMPLAPTVREELEVVFGDRLRKEI